jgi:hypothetical protein
MHRRRPIQGVAFIFRVRQVRDFWGARLFKLELATRPLIFACWHVPALFGLGGRHEVR